MTRFFLKDIFQHKILCLYIVYLPAAAVQHRVHPVLHNAQTLHVCNKNIQAQVIQRKTEIVSMGLLLLTGLILFQILKSQFKSVCCRDKIISLTTTQMHVITDVHEMYFFEAIIIILHKSDFSIYIPSYLLQSQ